MSEDSDVLPPADRSDLHPGGNVQLKDRGAGSEGGGRGGRRNGGTLTSSSLLRSALADSSLPQILLAVGVAVAVIILGVLNRGDVMSGINALASADAGWLSLATAAALSLFFVGTVTQFGSMPTNPPVKRVFAVQIAASFVNHLLPAGTGQMAVNVRFLHRAGLSRGAAVGSVGLNSLAGLVCHVTLLVGAVAISPAMMTSVQQQFDWTNWVNAVGSVPETVWLGSAAGVVVLAAAALIALRCARETRAGLWLLRLARRVRTLSGRIVREVKALGAVIRQPSRAAALWLGSFSVPLIHGLILFTVLKSIGAPIGIGTVMVTYVVVSSLAALVPSPGGVGALDVALPAAFATVGGISLTSALAGVVGYRLLTVWLPLLPSAAMFTFLLRKRII